MKINNIIGEESRWTVHDYMMLSTLIPSVCRQALHGTAYKTSISLNSATVYTWSWHDE